VDLLSQAVFEFKAKQVMFFYAKERMLAAILCKKDGQLLCSCSCLTSSKPEQKLLSMGLNMRTNNVEVLKNIN